MILLDPDLDPAPALRTKPALPSAPQGISIRSLVLFLREAQAAARLRGEVSVLLTSDRVLRRLNKQFRGKNKATDVLSFPSAAPAQVSKSRPGAPGNGVAGDLAISVETAQRQSAACGHSLAAELKILMLHGLLHLNGYDHEKDAGEMARKERALRARLGLEQGLIERAESRKGRTAGPSAPAVRRKRTAFAQDDSAEGARGSVRSHPSRKNKNAARVGHPPNLGSTLNGTARGAQ